MSKPSTYLKAYAYPGADLMEACVDACEAALKTGMDIMLKWGAFTEIVHPEEYAP